MNKSNSNHGIMALFLSGFLFSLFTTVNRFVPHGIGTFSQTFLRTGLMGIMFLVIGLFSKRMSKVENKDRVLLFARGIFVGADIAAFFLAANNLALGTAIFLFYAGAIVASFFYGSFILREKIDGVKVISLVSAFAGLAIIYLDNFSSFGNPFAIFAIIAGVCFGLANSTSKNLTDKYSIEQINSIAYLFSAALCIPIILSGKEMLNAGLLSSSAVLFLAFAALGVAAYYTAVYGFKYVEAQKASLILLVEIVFVFILGFIFYKETPTVKTVIGGIFVMIASVLPNIHTSSNSKNQLG